MDAPPVLSVIIVNYNVKEFLQQALSSLRKALQGLRAEVFVVDNASDDGSVQLVRDQFPEVKLILNQKNLGFSRANNLALKQARGEYVVLLNPDTVAQEDTFTKLLRFMQNHPDAGMVGCKILNPDGSLQLACRRSFPTPWVAFTRLAGLSYLFPKSRIFGKYNLSYLPENQVSRVEAISGSFMMMRRQVLEQIGLLDEAFFLYGEDLDYCYRTSQAGWNIYYVPETQIIHFKGESSKRSRLDNLLVFYQSMALFVKKHFRHRYFFVTYYFLLMAIWFRAAVSFVQSSFKFMVPLLIDILLMQTSLGAALLVKFGGLHPWKEYLPVNIIYTSAWLVALYAWGSYGRWKFSFSRAGAAGLSGFLFNSAFTYFFKQYAFSRAVLLLAGLFNVLLLAGWRLFFKLLHRFGLAPFKGTLGHTLLARRSLVVGDFSRGEKVLQKLKTRIGDGYELVGLVSLNPADVGRKYNGLEVIATPQNMSEVIHRRNIQEVIFSTHRIAYDRILKMISDSRSRRVNFKLVPSNLEVIIGKASIDSISDVPLLDIDYKLSSAGNRAIKRGFDVALSLAALVLGMPIFGYLWLRYPQHREWKTLQWQGVAGLREIKIRQLSQHGWFGKLMLLVPVLRGDWSLVGREMDTVENVGSLPGMLKPGITGLVQINAHKDLTRIEKEKYQLFYLMNYSPLLDLEILVKAWFKI